MEFKVKKPFTDKFTKKLHIKDSIYETYSVDRAKELQKAGYLGEEIKKQESTPPATGGEKSILDENVNTIKEAVTAELGREELEKLLQLESEGNKRKTVIKHIESLLKEEGTNGTEQTEG